jgi:hypothetical protein
MEPDQLDLKNSESFGGVNNKYFISNFLISISVAFIETSLGSLS